MNTVCVEAGKQKEKKSYADDFARIAFCVFLRNMPGTGISRS